MKQYVCAPLLAISVLLPVASTRLGGSERAALLAASGSAAPLASMRGGAWGEAAGIDRAERAALERAEQASRPLAAMRGGEIHLSDHDLKLIAVVLLAVLVVAAIA